MKRLHTCQQPLTLSYCNQGKENGKRNWLQKKAHTHLCLKHHPQITKLEWSWDFIREHGTKNIDIHNLDASGQLCRICISISSASYPWWAGTRRAGLGVCSGVGSGSGLGAGMISSRTPTSTSTSTGPVSSWWRIAVAPATAATSISTQLICFCKFRLPLALLFSFLGRFSSGIFFNLFV